MEGRITFFQDSRWDEVGPGASCFVPRGQVHTFKNAGPETEPTAPAGFDIVFSRTAEFARPGGPDMAQVMGIAAEHGIHFLKDGTCT